MSESCSWGKEGMAFDMPAVEHGVYVTFAYILVFYICICGQVITYKKHLLAYRSRGERFERYYNVVDAPVLGWDRVIGNYLEQAMPFLTAFWLNIGLGALGATSYRSVAAAGWVYVFFRALYPVSWFIGGGGRAGTKNPILISTLAMYGVIVYLLGNMVHAVRSR